MKHLLLTASILAIFSSSSFATNSWKEDVEDQVSLEVGQNKIVQKLLKSQDYTINLDESALVNKITKVVEVKNQDQIMGYQIKSEDISRETYHQISKNLDYLKTHKVRIGNGWSTTTNKHKDLCVEYDGIPLVYSTSSKGRDLNDSFLPLGYQSSFLSKPLYEEVKKYSQSKGLDEKSAGRLYTYLEPLFYLVQEQVQGMIGGLPKTKWTKSYEDFLKILKAQADHHVYMNSRLGLKGLDRNEVMEALTPSLLGKAVSVIPSPHRVIHKDDFGGYILALNVKGDLCMVHPLNGIHYPIFTKDAKKGDMHLPVQFARTSGLYKQWKRVGDFISGHDKIIKADKPHVHKLLEAVGYLANEHFQNLRIDIPNELLVDTVQKFMDENLLKKEAKEDFPYAMHRHFFNDNYMMESLHKLHDKVEQHNEMIQPYYPVSLRKFERDILPHEMLGYLLHNEIIDRLSEKLKEKFDVFADGLRKFQY